MSRPAIGRLLGAAVAVALCLVVLSGSDLPPPPAWLLVAVGCALVGVLIAVATPRLLDRAERTGPLRGLLAGTGLGAATGLAAALVLAAGGSGEPSLAADSSSPALLIGVLLVVGAVGGLYAGVLALLADRAATRSRAAAVLLAPNAAIAMVAVLVIGIRLSGSIT